MENKLVVQKDNEIVRNTINKFNYKQNQLMCVLLGKYIHTKNNECIDTTISIDELRQVLGLSDGKNNYERIKNAINKFGENGSVGIYDEAEDRYIWRPYFKQIVLSKTQVSFSWNDLMKEDLINLKGKYTQYLSNDYLRLDSLYSQNLYEQMKSYQNMPKVPQVVFTVADLHRIMQTEGKKAYKTFNQLKTRCIELAIKDINEKTDITVTMEPIKDTKDKRKVFGCAFTIKQKNKKFKYGSRNNLWLTEDELNDIIMVKKAKWILNEVSVWKDENPDKYSKYKKSDYEVCLKWFKEKQVQLNF